MSFHRQRGLTGEQVLETTFDWVGGPQAGQNKGNKTTTNSGHDSWQEERRIDGVQLEQAQLLVGGAQLEGKNDALVTNTQANLQSSFSNLSLSAVRPASVDKTLSGIKPSYPNRHHANTAVPAVTRALDFSTIKTTETEGNHQSEFSTPPRSPSLQERTQSDADVSIPVLADSAAGAGTSKVTLHVAAREGWIEVMEKILGENPEKINDRELPVRPRKTHSCSFTTHTML